LTEKESSETKGRSRTSSQEMIFERANELPTFQRRKAFVISNS
jgi:hypothetical protein